MDFTEEELLEVAERLVGGLLERAGITAPPVDALRIAEEHLGIPVEVVDPIEEDEGGRRRPRTRPAGSDIVLAPDMTEEQRQKVAAEGIGRTLAPQVMRKLNVIPGTESKSLVTHLRRLIASRILVPTRLFKSALRDCKHDLLALKARFATAAPETIALRMLDLDDPCVISIVDDGVVSVRRGNRQPAGKKLEAVEQSCHDRAAELELAYRVRGEGWTVQAWPVPDRPFRRIILRSVPDEGV